MIPQKIFKYLVILSFGRRYSKQNTVASQKYKVLSPPNFWADYATGGLRSLSDNELTAVGRGRTLEQNARVDQMELASGV